MAGTAIDTEACTGVTNRRASRRVLCVYELVPTMNVLSPADCADRGYPEIRHAADVEVTVSSRTEAVAIVVCTRQIGPSS